MIELPRSNLTGMVPCPSVPDISSPTGQVWEGHSGRPSKSGWPIERISSLTMSGDDLAYPPGTEVHFTTSGSLPTGMATTSTYTIRGQTLGKPAPFTAAWIRCNRGRHFGCGRAIYPCFDLEADRAEAAGARRRLLWSLAFLMGVLALATWPIWSGR